MSQSFDSAVQSLARSADAALDERLGSRLNDVQALLGRDLEFVETALQKAAAGEPDPANAAAAHLIGLGGKRVRPTAVLLSAACFGAVPRAARELAVVVELIHSATLLHDDVVDDGSERRGAKTSRLLWGNAVSVLAGDALLVQSLERTLEHAPELMPGLLATLRQLVSGEVVQLRGRQVVDLTEATYEQILRDKTASLFRFAASGGAALGGAAATEANSLGEFGEHLGMAFQLVDDLLDYTGFDSGKTLCSDLLEGKVTLPLVLAAKNQPVLLDWVQQIRAGQLDRVEPLRRMVVDSGACEAVRIRARQETQRALTTLERIDDSPARSLLRSIAEKLADRDR